MWYGIISIYPKMFNILKEYGITSYAYKNNIININFFNPIFYSKDNSYNIYNKPYGGGPGMVMSFQPINDAINAAKLKKPDSTIIYVTPKGKLIDNNLLLLLSKKKSIIFISGRYEDIDYRIIENNIIDEELSIGDYIISGGELAIMIIIDAISRLLPNVIKNSDSINIESFNNFLLDYQQYTRPYNINGYKVPEILLNGNHKEISQWRYKQRLGNTFFKRPDILLKKKLSLKDKILLNEFILELYTI